MGENLSLIIVTYNSVKEIENCLYSVFKNKKFSPQEIIIIDNNSMDNTVGKIYDKFKSYIDKKIIKIIKNKKNLGFSRGVNQGIKLSSCSLVLLLNPDTVIINNGIEKIFKFFISKKYLPIIGGGLLKPDEKTYHGTYVRKINFFTALFDFTNLKKLFPKNIFHKKFYFKDKNQGLFLSVWGLSGGFLLIHKSVFERIGLFDDSFFMYLEDLDFCYRAKKEKINVFYYPKACAVHFSGSSSANKFKINVMAWRSSRRYLCYKYINRVLFYFVKNAFCLDNIITDFIHLLKRYENSHN